MSSSEKAAVGRKLRVLDLFSGIGGFSLGLERTGGFETVAFCEIEEFPRRVLHKHWPDIPCYRDVRELTAATLAADGIAVDVICGGFPCQPFSNASRGRKVAIDLWPEMARIISEVLPRAVIAENVQRGPLERVAEFLAELGYPRPEPRRISGAEAGADHRRDRWWVCAHADDKSELSRAIDAEMAVLPELCRGLWGASNFARAVRVPDGLPDRVDRIESLGNAVMPVIPELIGRAILKATGAKS